MAKEITSANFEQEVKNSTKPVIIDFFAEWCGPCQQMAPHFEALSEELGDTYTFGKINIENERELAIDHQVSSIPTLIMYKGGERVAAFSGFLDKEEIKQKIAEAFVS